MKHGKYCVTLIYVCSFNEIPTDAQWEDTSQCALACLPVGLLSVVCFLILNILWGSDLW